MTTNRIPPKAFKAVSSLNYESNKIGYSFS